MSDTPRRLLPYPWQESQWQQLSARREAGRLPHALLLTGLAGLGKRHLAAALAQGLLCRAPTSDGTACGTCRSCELFAAGTHPDCREITPFEDKKELGIDQVRELTDYQYLKPQYTDRKIITLYPADRMTMSAANALLKTLEEPTQGTLLLLITDHPEGLLPTIRSRCQRLQFPPVEDGSADQWLQERLPERDPKELLQISGGAPLVARALAEEDILTRRAALLTKLAELLDARGAPVDVAQEALAEGPERVVLWLQGWVADLVRLRSGGSPQQLGNPDLLERLQAIAERVDLERLYRYFDRLQEARRNLGSPVNDRLLLEELFIFWSQGLVRRSC